MYPLLRLLALRFGIDDWGCKCCCRDNLPRAKALSEERSAPRSEGIDTLEVIAWLFQCGKQLLRCMEQKY